MYLQSSSKRKCGTYTTSKNRISIRLGFLTTASDEPVSFRRTFLEACQGEFDASITTIKLSAQNMDGLGSPEILREKMRRKGRLVTIGKFAGHLFVGNVKFIAIVARQLDSSVYKTSRATACWTS